MIEYQKWQMLAMLKFSKSGLDAGGDHGVPHWVRVCANGARLAKVTGANPKVVALFGMFHDCCRLNEHEDPEHGLRASEYVKELALLGRIDVTPEELALLVEAIRDHSEGKTKADITVQTCWDADRLDIGRVGVIPAARWMCTDAAKLEIK